MRAALLLALAGALTCCASRSPLPTTVCHAPRIDTADQEPTDGEWARLLSVADETRRGTCEPLLARASAAHASCDVAPRGARVAVEPVVLAREPIDEATWIVWVGDARVGETWGSGPIAVVRRTELGLEVQALGRHDGPFEGARARALRAGETDVVVIETERCASGAPCTREARFLVRAGGALTPATVRSGPRCEAAIDLRRGVPAVSLEASDWVVTSTVETAGDALLVREHASLRPRSEDGVARPAVREASAERRLVIERGALRADREALLSRLLDEDTARDPHATRAATHR